MKLSAERLVFRFPEASAVFLLLALIQDGTSFAFREVGHVSDGTFEIRFRLPFVMVSG